MEAHCLYSALNQWELSNPIKPVYHQGLPDGWLN